MQLKPRDKHFVMNRFCMSLIEIDLVKHETNKIDDPHSPAAHPCAQKAILSLEDMSFKCLFYAEVVTTPIALLIMGCLVRHWRLLILPLFSVTWQSGSERRSIPLQHPPET